MTSTIHWSAPDVLGGTILTGNHASDGTHMVSLLACPIAGDIRALIYTSADTTMPASFIIDSAGTVRALSGGEISACAAYCATLSTISDPTTVVFGVDGAGDYMGLVDISLTTEVAAGPPPSDGNTYKWLGTPRAWVVQIVLAAYKVNRKDALDIVAGVARGRHITNIPGQSEAYIVKSAQAQAYKDAGYTGTVPLYVTAQKDAMVGGSTNTQAADAILAERDNFHTNYGPPIERERVKGKRLIDAAANVAAVDTEYATAKAALDAI